MANGGCLARCRAHLWWVLFFVAHVTGPAHARAKAPAPDDIFELSLEELERIDVTVASLFDTTELDTPSTVDIITEADWRRRGARRLTDAINDLPAVIAMPHNQGGSDIAIRGYAGLDSSAGVAYTWDDIPLNDLYLGTVIFSAPDVNLGSLDEIQFVRGPGSALYGSDAFHGVLALHAYETEENQKEVEGGFGLDGYYKAGARYSTPAYGSARLNMALAANGQPDQHRTYSFMDPNTGQTLSGERAMQYDTETATLKLVSNHADGFTYRWGLYANHYQPDRFPGTGTRVAATNDQSGQDAYFYATQATVGWTLANRRSLELNGYSWIADQDDSIRTTDAESVHDRDTSIPQHRVGARLTYRDFIAPWNTRWALALGAEQLGVDDSRVKLYSADGTLLRDISHPAANTDRTIHSFTFEANTPWDDDRWNVTYGARLDHYSDVDNHLSPRLGLIYHPQPTQAIKLLYGNAFRAPGAIQLLGSPERVEANRDLKPEVIDTYELTWLKHTHAEKIKIVFFRSIWNEALVGLANPSGTAPIIVENAAQNTAHGAAIAFQRETDPWRIKCSASYVESERTTTDEFYGMFPKVILNLGLGYTLAQYATEFYLNQRVHLEADDVQASSAGFPAQELPTYWRVDATASKALNKRAELMLTLRNLLDRDNKIPSPSGSRGGIPDEPFSISLGARYGY